MVGSFRGHMQTNPAALQDIRRQMASLQLPSTKPAMHERPRGASAQMHLSDNVAQQPLRPDPQRGTKVKPVAPAAPTAAAAAVATPAPLADVDVDPEDDEKTVPEGTSRAELQREFIRISRVQDRRQERLLKQEAGVQEQTEVISAAQSELVLRQAAVDHTQTELRELKAQAALLAQRIAEAEAFRDDVETPVLVSPLALTEAQQAADCMRKTLTALRHFAEIECPEVRSMLVEFVRDFKAIELEQAPIQTNTLAQTFAAQKAAAAVLAQVQTAAAVSSASQSPPMRPSLLELTPEAHSQTPFQEGADMLVVGECVGDKRKSEQIAPADDERCVDGNGQKAARPADGEDECLSFAKARKSLKQALNIRIRSEKSSRCASLGP